ncbi:STAS domain-containing protein [Arthrobacter halodurans]|jgi:anti-sigma B factor antagonist|uniref:Anti-sigma factor antagonist n=1 Tax=Arthrobacter halodurans TaxID=516699 RepID=A0ABV4UQ33_9MICC
MQFNVEAAEGYTEVAGTGRLNMVAAPRLREVVADTVAAGNTRIVVNLADTEFMDSSGLGALIGCLKLARQAGGDLRIACVPAQVLMVLQLTGMDRVLTPHPSVAGAFSGD